MGGDVKDNIMMDMNKAIKRIIMGLRKCLSR